ncbi:MAG TPA: hypothetical protein VF649_05390 [Sphingomonas sp.]|jgi:hypothetical protein|uniref:hypothetical protein n=1 Tax=Sphingomonas sp. TaxID=28214 RepID=UPI002ED7A02E
MPLRPLLLALLSGLLLPAPIHAAGPAPFDLAGPGLRVTVTHGSTTLPIAQVPNLAAGDRVSVLADLPADQGTRYLLIAAFLRGATNPPPKSWFYRAETWRREKNGLTLVVPPGARQLVLFLVPETGGGYDAIVETIRKQPGAFVRASQDLNQASLDRARLDTFLDQVQALERTHPERIEAVSPLLTRSLAIKLNAECLQQASDVQASCLTQSRDSLLLADSHSSTITETLIGAPTDLALQLAATPQGGYGYYSPYIGAVRDLARIFGAFQSTQLQYIPALNRPQGDRIALLLNAAPSFAKPRSVIVAALPAIDAPHVPPLRRAEEDRGFCAARRDLVLPVDGAALVYATAYAHDMVLRAARPGGGTVDVPVRADPAQGGFVLTGDPAALPASAEATLHGVWGFTPFDGPRFRLQAPIPGGIVPADPGATTVIIGRDNALTLQGPATRCIESITLGSDPATLQPLAWKDVGANRITVTLPLANAAPGTLALVIRQHGLDHADTIVLTALAEAGRIDGLTLHAGDRSAVLAGTRLDMVTALTVDGIGFRPGALTRTDSGDRLALTADAAPPAPFTAGQDKTARITLADERARPLAFTIAAARPAADLVARTVDAPRDPARPAVLLAGDAVVPQDGRLTFSFRTRGTTRLSAGASVEVATADEQFTARLSAGHGLTIQDDHVAVAAIAPGAALGGSAHGPLRFRLIQDDVASDWVPLAILARRPTLATFGCSAPGAPCRLTGSDLFLIDAIARAPDFRDAVIVPEGFTGGTLDIPGADTGTLFVRLRDAPGLLATLAPPGAS